MDQMTTPPSVNANPPALSELGAMGDEELNGRLAKLCGWHTSMGHKLSWMTPNDPKKGKCHHRKRPPSFCTDANAVAEVRKGLSDIERFRFANHVSKQITGNDHQCSSFALIDASPRHQTIALILTLQ